MSGTLGPMNGATSSTHPSCIRPICERMPDLRLLSGRTRATREAGIGVPVLDACDALGLDLLDRLLLLALLRDNLDVRCGRGLPLSVLCDAAGAADWSQQDAVRSRLEVAGSLRRLLFVQSDIDPVLWERSYRLDPRWKAALLAGRTRPDEETAPVGDTSAARLQEVVSRAARLLYLVGPPRTERVQAWSDANPDAPGWDRLSRARRLLSVSLSSYLSQDGAGTSDPFALALCEAGVTSPAEAAILATLLGREAEDDPVGWPLLSVALEGFGGADTGFLALVSPETPLIIGGLVECGGTDESLPPAFRIAASARARIVPSGLASARRREAAATSIPESAETVEKVAPRLTLSGLVLCAPTRARLVDALAVPRALVAAAEWGASESLLGSTGVAILLYGPPGTGKTLAAEAIAGELGRTLWRLRTDQLLGKYVGETEKRIAAVFRAAREAGDVVLLDEADSLLASRDSLQQRWEVSATNLLLQEIERFPGVVVLTTNRDAALDPALERRLLARLEIGMPGPEEREQLWQRHLPPRAPRAADVDLPALARAYPLSGSNIRTAALLAVAKAASRAGDARLLTRTDLHDAAAAQLARSPETKTVVGFSPAHASAPRLALVAARHDA